MIPKGTKTPTFRYPTLGALLLLTAWTAICATPTTSQRMKQGSFIELKIKELHKVMRDDDPSGRNQNMKVVLEPHAAMDADDFELTLVLSGESKTYFLHEILDEDATEIEFEGNFEDSNNVIIKAEKDGSLVGFGSVVETITDLGSRVARVGDASAPSLRVDPGARDQVDVPGKPPCVKGSGPCYYLGQSEPPAPLCEDLPSIKFCDAIVSEAQNPPNVPTLELHNREELRVQPRPVGPKTEVVVSSTQDDSILSPDDLGCNDLGDDMCSQPVDIADDLESFDVTIVTLDDEGYVTESIAVLFEVHRVSTLSFSSDVLNVVVEPRSEGTYEVTLPGSSPPLELEAECQAGSPCRVWFAGVEAPASVSVKKESNVIFQNISTGPPPPSSKIERITSLGLDSKTLVEVLSDKPVTRADLVTFKSNVALDTDCETLPTTPLDSGYSLTAALHDAGEWNFIVVGYDDDGTLLEAGRVKVTLLVMDARVAVVGAALDSPHASLRVDVGSQDDVAIEGVGSCVKADSPCYFLTQSLTEDTLRYCVTITNSAGLESQDVEQCDASFTSFKPMAEEPKLELIDGAKMKVTTEGSTANNVEMIIFNLQTDDILSVSSPLCPPEADGSCSQEVNIPEGLQEFRVLVVAVDGSGEVKESILSPFYDFMTSVQHFNDGTDLEVRWRTSSEQTFIVSVEEDVSGAFTQTSITCGREIRTCKAYFTKLSTGTVHWVKVTKDKTAVSISVSPHQDTTTPLSIARISKVSTVGGQVQLTISSDTEVEGAKYLEYVVLEPLAGSESVQHIAFADFNDVIHAGNVITFEDVEAPKTNVEVTVMVIAHSDSGVDSDALAFGKSLVTFEEIKLPRMTKVGTESFQSLKVETSAMTVKVNGFTCPASTVCYYLEPENIKEPPEVCRMANPTVEQCDMTAMYIVPEVLVDPSVQLNYIGVPKEDLIVAAEFSDTSIRMEAKLYTDTEVLTPKPLACEITGRSLNTCVFKVEPQVTEFKILLMALSADSIVTKSNVVEFEDFQTRIQEMTTGTIDVTWRASDNQYFDIEIFPEIEGSFSSSTVECGGDDPEDISRCSAFFFALELNKDYTASVRVRGDHRSVSAAVKLEPILETINITELILSKTGDARTDLNVCFMEDQQAGNKDTQKEEENLYRLVAVDANGRQLWMTSNPSLSSVSVVEDKLCLGPLPLDLDFDLSDKVWILVTRGEDAAGDVEVFPLDPREVEVKQVGKGTLRARWTNSNKAPSFEVGTSSDDLSSVECGAGEEAERECLRYLHVENTNTPVTVTLREIGLSVQQEVQVELTLEDLPDIIITETELTLDNRLRVCFESHSEDSLYLLALENAEGDVQEASQLLPSQEDGLTCVLTNDAVQAEGYVSLWTLLAAFNDSGALQASGNTGVSDFFLSARRSVGAAWNTDTHDLLVSWFLLSDPKTISSYHVALEETTAGGGNDPIKVGNDKSSYVFKNKTGRYSVCVAAYVEENGSTSREVCSAILSLPQSPVTVPEIGETTLKSAAPNKVLVTWQKPQEDADVSSYVITWRTDISSRSSSSSSSSSNPARSLPQPLGLIQAANPVSDDDDLAFRVIPASTSSIEVEVEASQKYEMCVSSVKSDVMGKRTCNKVDQGNYAQLDQPKDLVFENEALSWAEVPTAEYYLVEWRPRNAGGLSEGGSQEVTSTTWPTQDLSPGTWMVEVRAALGSSVSDSTGIEIRKDGITIGQATQTSNSVLELSWWEEPVPSCAQTPCTYIITLNNGREQQHLCSGLQGDCTKSLNGVQGPEGNVTVTRDTPSTIGWRIYDFKAVGEVNQTFAPGAEEVTLSWAEMEGAKKYNVTLFADEALSSVRHTEMLSKETCTLAKSNMIGNVFSVQPCADDQHCGDALKVTLRETSVDQPPGDNLAFIISISVVGGLLAVILVASLVVVALKKNIENKKRKENSPQQQEFEMTYPVYNEWGARPLGRRAQWPPQSPYRK